MQISESKVVFSCDGPSCSVKADAVKVPALTLGTVDMLIGQMVGLQSSYGAPVPSPAPKPPQGWHKLDGLDFHAYACVAEYAARMAVLAHGGLKAAA